MKITFKILFFLGLAICGCRLARADCPEKPLVKADLAYTSEIVYFNSQNKLKLITSSSITTCGSRIRVATKTGDNLMITLSDGRNIYQLDLKNKRAYHQKTLVPPARLSGQINGEIKNKDFKITGTEFWDGKKCQLYEFEDRSARVKEKVWFWEERKFPIKIETETGPEKMVIKNTGISSNQEVDPAIFLVPGDFKIIEVRSDAKN